MAAGCLQGIRMWIHGFLRAVPSAGPPLALQLPEEIFLALSSTQRHRKLPGLGMGRSICFGRMVQEGGGRDPPAAGSPVGASPSPQSDLAAPGSDGEEGRRGTGVIPGTLGTLPFGNLSHGDRMLQNQGLYILLPDTDREKLEHVWPREVEGEEDFVFGGAAIPQPPQDRHNPVPAVALENSSKCSQDSQDCPKSTLSHFISQN